MLTINKAITRSLAAALALTLAWPPPASALKVQTSSESSGLEELSSALNPVAMSPTQRRQIERVLWDDHHRRTLKRGVVSERKWDALDARSLGHFHPPAPYEGTRQSNYSGLPWLQWQLGHPLLETEEIRARQEAVREILTARAPDHRPLGFTLREWIQGRWHGIFPSSLPQDWSNPGPGWPNVWTVAHERWVRQEVLDALTGPIPSGPIRSMEDDERRKKIRFIRDRVPKDLWRLGQGMQALAVLLGDAQSPRLRALRWVAQAASDAHHPYQLARLGQPRPLTVKEAAEILTHRHRSIALLLRAAREVDTHRVVAELASVGGDYERFSHWSSWRHSSRRAWKTFPAILSPVAGRPHLFIRHGQALRPLATAGRSVPNSVRLGTQDPARPNPTVAVIVGPNTEGKSTYLRMAGLLVLLASVGSPVPAAAMAMTPLMVRVHSSLADDPKTARSLFRVQSDDLQDIDRDIHQNPLTLVLLDEMLPGTYPRGRRVLEQDILSRMADTGALIMLATHNLRLATRARQKSGWTTLCVTGYRVRPSMMTHQEADRAILRTLRQSGWPRPFVASVRRHLGDGRTSSTRTGLEEPPTPSGWDQPMARREFLKTLSALAQLGTRLGALADALAPAPSSAPPAWDPYRGALRAAVEWCGVMVGEDAAPLTLDLMLTRKAGWTDREAFARELPNLLRTSGEGARQSAAAHARFAEALQQRLSTTEGRAALIPQLRARVQTWLQDEEKEWRARTWVTFDAEIFEKLVREDRELLVMLGALPAEQVAEGMRWAASEQLQEVRTIIEDLSAIMTKAQEGATTTAQPGGQSPRSGPAERSPEAPANQEVAPAPRRPSATREDMARHEESPGILGLLLTQMPAPGADESLADWRQWIQASQGEGLVSPVEESARRLRTLLRNYHFAQQVAFWEAFVRTIPSVMGDPYRVAWLTDTLQELATLHEMQGPPLEAPIQEALALLRAAPSATAGPSTRPPSADSLRTGLEEPGEGQTRREFLKTLATLARLSTRLGTLAEALAPPASAAIPAWDPYRAVLPLAFDELGFATAGNRALILALMLNREAKKAGIMPDPATSAVSLASSLSAFIPQAQRLAVAHVQWGETLQQRLANSEHRAALIQQLRQAVNAEISRLESGRVGQSYKATMKKEGWPLPEYRALATMLDTLPASQIAQGLGWAAGEHLRDVRTVIENLSVAAADPIAQARSTHLARARTQWMAPSPEVISRAPEQFRVTTIPDFRRLEGSVVGFYLEGEGLRFVRPLALAIAQVPTGVATLAGVVSTEADRAALVESLAAVPAAQTLAAEGVVTLGEIPNERDAREEAFRRLHAHGATYSHMITAEHDEDPVAYLQQLLAQLGVTLPPDLEHPDQLDPTAHTAALTLLRAAASSAGMEEPKSPWWERPINRREFLERSGKTLAALSRLGHIMGALSKQFLAGVPTAPTPPAWEAYRPALRGVVQEMEHHGATPAGLAKLPGIFVDVTDLLPQPGDPPAWSRKRWALGPASLGVARREIQGHAKIDRRLLAQLAKPGGSVVVLQRLKEQASPQGIRTWIADHLPLKDSTELDTVLALAGRPDVIVDELWARDKRLANFVMVARSRLHGAQHLTLLTQRLSDEELIEGLCWAHGDYLRTAQREIQTVEHQIATLREVGALMIPNSGPPPRPGSPTPPAIGTRHPTHELLRRLRERGASLTSEQAQVILTAQAAGATEILLLPRFVAKPGVIVTVGVGPALQSALTARVQQWVAWPSAETPIAFVVQALPAERASKPMTVAVRLASQPRVEGMPNLVVTSPEALDRVTAALVATVAHAALPPADQDLPVVAVLPLTLDGRDLLALFL